MLFCCVSIHMSPKRENICVYTWYFFILFYNFLIMHLNSPWESLDFRQVGCVTITNIKLLLLNEVA